MLCVGLIENDCLACDARVSFSFDRSAEKCKYRFMSELAQIEAVKKAQYAERRLAGKTLADVNPTAISQSFILAINACITPKRVAESISGLLGATRELKSGAVLPDYRAQEAGVRLYLAYTIGLPVQRQEIITVAVDSDNNDGMMERLKSSPAARAALRKALDAAEAPAIDCG